jgi:hypothetical protein
MAETELAESEPWLGLDRFGTEVFGAAQELWFMALEKQLLEREGAEDASQLEARIQRPCRRQGLMGHVRVASL